MLKTKLSFGPISLAAIMSKKTVDWLTGQNIPFVPKKDNLPNVPQARPVKNFWAVLKRMVYEKGWEAQNEQQLIGRIKRKLNQIDKTVFQSMMEKVRYTLRKIEDNGPLGVL